MIDFTITSLQTLKSICDEFKINFDVLKKDKEDFKFYKIWIDTQDKTMIAYSTVKKPQDIIYTSGLSTILQSFSSYQLKPVINLDELDVDKILEKISKFGINSLLKEEKEFLDNVSKS